MLLHSHLRGGCICSSRSQRQSRLNVGSLGILTQPSSLAHIQQPKVRAWKAPIGTLHPVYCIWSDFPLHDYSGKSCQLSEEATIRKLASSSCIFSCGLQAAACGATSFNACVISRKGWERRGDRTGRTGATVFARINVIMLH